VDNNTSALIAILVVIVIFFIARELVCWYWKINTQVTLLTEIRDLLRAQASASRPTGSDGRREPSVGALE
jgi:hypothetical protein